MSRPAAAAASDLVPLADRVRLMQVFRGVAACAVLAAWVVLPEVRRASLRDLVLATTAYLAVSFASEGIWRRRRRRGLTLFSAMLIVDSVYLAWLAYVTEGPTTPLRYLILLHLITVALLASFRTGLKLALWHSLLLFATFHAQEAGLLATHDGQPVRLGDADFRRHVAFALVFWLVALVTSGFAAVNERELRRRRYDLEALARLALQLEKARDPATVARVLTDTVAEEFGLERVVLLGGPVDELRTMSSKGLRPPPGGGSVLPGPRSVLRHSTGTHRTQLITNLHPHDDPWLSVLFPDARNLMVVPLYAEGRAIGVFVAEHSLRAGSRVERRVVSMLERFVSQAALALSGAWLLERVQRMAAIDGLTGVANRRSFDDALQRELARAGRSGDPVSLILADIDHFKRLNDTFGHQAGDEVLRLVASALTEQCRPGDTIARYGGEEFAIVLPGLTAADAQLLAERLRRTIGQLEAPIAVTASFGVATYPDHATDPSSLTRAADEALYSSKRAGRNRSTTWNRTAVRAG